MIGIVDASDIVLNDIAARLHTALENSGLRYSATAYGEVHPHPTEPKYALFICENELYCPVVMEELTAEKEAKIEEIGIDWWAEE